MNTALVTGACRGIGLAVALELAATGRRVYATMRDPGRAPPELRQSGATLLTLDVTRPETIRATIAAIGELEGDVPDLVINNAAIGVIAALEHLEIDEFRAVLETNVIGVHAVCHAVASAMRRRGHGRIVNIGSIGGRIATPGLGSYSASKFALAGYTSVLRRELGPLGVDAILVELGAVSTDLIGPARPIGRGVAEASDGAFAEVYQRLHRLMQLSHERLGMRPSDAARRIVAVATARRAGARHVIGADAKVLAWIARIGEGRRRDRLLDRSFGVIMAQANRRFALGRPRD